VPRAHALYTAVGSVRVETETMAEMNVRATGRSCFSGRPVWRTHARTCVAAAGAARVPVCARRFGFVCVPHTVIIIIIIIKETSPTDGGGGKVGRGWRPKEITHARTRVTGRGGASRGGVCCRPWNAFSEPRASATANTRVCVCVCIIPISFSWTGYTTRRR